MLIYSNDFDAHLQVVVKFAEFLQWCGFVVKLDVWDNHASVHNRLWLDNEVEKADKVSEIITIYCTKMK